MASAVARAYNGNLGAEPSAGSRDRAPGQRVRRRSSPEAEALLVFRLSMEAANLPKFLKFGNANKSHICVIFAKKLWVVTKLGGMEQNWGLCPPALCPPAPAQNRHCLCHEESGTLGCDRGEGSGCE